MKSTIFVLCVAVFASVFAAEEKVDIVKLKEMLHKTRVRKIFV